MVKTPACVFSDLSKIAKARQAYFSELYKYPTDAELATLTGLTIARVKYLKDIDFEVVSTEDKPDETLPGVYSLVRTPGFPAVFERDRIIISKQGLIRWIRENEKHLRKD